MINPGRLISGTVVLLVGFVFLLINLDLLPGVSLKDVLRLWPLLLIFLGIRMIIGYRNIPVWLAILVISLILLIAAFALLIASGANTSDIFQLALII